jgi:hypothetical protein
MNVSVVMIAVLSMARADAGQSNVDVDGIVVTVEGEAAVYADPDQALKEAKRAARVNALEVGAGPLVERHVLLRVHRDMTREIATTVKGVITDEKWGAPRTSADGKTVTVALTAKVNRSVIEQVLCTVIQANHDPKISLVVVERAGTRARWSNEGVTRAALESAFRDACFTIVGRVSLKKISAKGEPSPEELRRIVHDSNAQYVLVAAAEATAVNDRPGSWAASLRAKLFNTSTSVPEVVTSSSTTVQADSAIDAMSRALTSSGAAGEPPLITVAMNDLMKHIASRWNGDAPSSSRLQVLVKDSAGQRAAKAVTQLMQKVLEEGTNIELRSADGPLKFDVFLIGDAETFANAVEGKKVGKEFIEVIEVSRGRVILKLSPKPYTPN